jgi:hypothetical protein
VYQHQLDAASVQREDLVASSAGDLKGATRRNLPSVIGKNIPHSHVLLAYHVVQQICQLQLKQCCML